MKRAMHETIEPAKRSVISQSADYDRIAQAILFITTRADKQPTLVEIAAHVNLSPFHFQRLFSRWAGVTPKRFLQVLTLDRAKMLLRESKPLLDVSDTLGLSSGSRLYDHFVQLEAVTPGEYKRSGDTLSIQYGVHNTPFGSVFVATTNRGICKLAFLESGTQDLHLTDLRTTWHNADITEDHNSTLEVVTRMFAGQRQWDRPLSLFVSGTNLQINVWRALLQIPPGSVTSYANVAAAIGRPRSARAVGLALGANPVAFLIPCHRVIQQSGKLGGYHWGENRKHAIHAWESARCENTEPSVQE